MRPCWVCNRPLPDRTNPLDRRTDRNTCPRSVSLSCYIRKQAVTLRGHVPTVAEAQRLKTYYGIVYDHTTQQQRRSQYNRRQRTSNDPGNNAAVVALSDLDPAPEGCRCHVHSPVGNYPGWVHVCEVCGGTGPCRRCLHRGGTRNLARDAA